MPFGQGEGRLSGEATYEPMQAHRCEHTTIFAAASCFHTCGSSPFNDPCVDVPPLSWLNRMPPSLGDYMLITGQMLGRSCAGRLLPEARPQSSGVVLHAQTAFTPAARRGPCCGPPGRRLFAASGSLGQQCTQTVQPT